MGLLQRLFGRTTPPPHQAVLMVLLDDEAPLDGARVIGHLRTHWPDSPPVGTLDNTAGTTRATIAGGAVGLVHIVAPVPPNHIEGPAAVAWHWPDAQRCVAAHQAHVVVHVASETLDAVSVELLAMRIAASVMAVSNACGVHVGAGMLVRSAEDYQADAASGTRQMLPMLSLVGFNLVDDENGLFSAYTTGLARFGALDLEVRGTTLEMPELIATMVDTACYQVQTGRTLGDGHTFGATPEDRTRVRHDESTYFPGETVAVLDLPGRMS